MAQRAGACLLFGLLLGACGVGDSGGGDTGKPTVDATSDDPDVLLGIQCRAAFKLQGTWTAGTPARPTGQNGCWPVGTWNFTATVDTSATFKHPCTTPPTTLASYSFRVDRTDPDGNGLQESYTYLGDMAMLGHLKVSELGGGCEGQLELWSVDNKSSWIMQPFLMDVGGISGKGDYASFTVAQTRE